MTNKGVTKYSIIYLIATKAVEVILYRRLNFFISLRGGDEKVKAFFAGICPPCHSANV